jgi:hypothetical protein
MIIKWKPKSKLCYDGRSGIFFCRTVSGLLLWSVHYDDRTGLSFTISAGSRQRSHSQIRVQQYSSPYVPVSDSRLPQPGGPGPLIYIPQEQGGPVIPPGTGVPLHRLLGLAGLRWSYSNPPPHGRNDYSQSKLLYNLRFTSNQFVLSPSPLRITTREFFQLNPCGHSPYVTSPLTRGWVYLLWTCLAFCQVYVSHT